MGSQIRSACRPGTSSPGGGIYRTRSPRASALWQCAKRHALELRTSGRMQRSVEQQVIENPPRHAPVLADAYIRAKLDKSMDLCS